VKRRAGLIDEWQRRETRDPVVRCHRCVDIAAERLGVRRRQRTRIKRAVGEPRAVGEEIVERDRPRGRHRVVEVGVERAQHARAPELRRPVRDRVVEREAALLEQLQRGHRRDRLAQ